MYCIECGAQIPNNSKFCSHCGYKQIEGEPSLNEKLAEVIIEKEITRQVVEEHKTSIDFEFLKKVMGWYLAWVLLHLGLLLIGSDGIFDGDNMGAKRFWPLGDYADLNEVNYYDITEFLVYTIFPLAILVIWSMVRTQANDIEQNPTE
ncbi:zinc ribbon domain-containing protein [Acetobacteroides hydrogenigenes]|uniref:Zinc ribbon protein n=1 Tax=Acetobacteroides hydrogenigenes TaxID=979970 RepID=A0A4R2EW04_9BACT|nr:zinc ribbon domain-containing protein [Acetobacteroides hydrogenigenes]TCN72866.1 zinc ribbon protein [Acetobacteroides hydrogenigenes]